MGLSLSGMAAFQETLIKPTLDNALKTEFFRDHWRGIDCSAEIPPSELLSKLPVCTKAQIKGAGWRARVADGQIVHEMFTSGTTQDAFAYAVGERESDALSIFYRSLWGEALNRPKRRVIRFLDPGAGGARYVPTPTRFHNFSVGKRGSFKHVTDEVLRRTWREVGVEDQVTVLSGSERVLRAFTEAVRARFPNGFENPLQYIYSSSSLLTDDARRDYEDFWGCEVIDRYGLSETGGGATQDARGWYYFDPVLVPEVVSTGDRQPVKEGRGMLVLTPLFPFQEVQPLVRYWTNDVVEVTHRRSSLPGRLAVRPLGRASDGVYERASDTWLLTPDIVFRVLEDRMDIERAPLFVECAQVVDHYRAGLPLRKLIVSHGSGGTSITLRVAVKAGPDARDSVLGGIRRGILQHAPDLRLACEKGTCRFAVVHSDEPEAEC
ncbi:MAG: hypothetical protein K9H25_04510 [Rhodospirillum sp.]|nr:hypothetical protein [Rhodospirillum sp.]MCF8488358.1 hypothetical protein [Rhodospirillum sp.]